MITKKRWFAAKKFGWGWTPISWQGWVTTALYLLYILWRARAMQALFDSGSSRAFRFGFELIPPTIILIVICYLTGEKPRWRWGK